MTREEFSQNLTKATMRSHELALMAVKNELKQPFTFLVELNCSYDGNPLAEGEVVLQKIRAKGHAPIGPLSFEDVVSLLWRERFVPEWVDIVPWEANSSGVIFRLICCGRFTEGRSHLYHKEEGFPPFHAPGVRTPPDWESIEINGRIDVNWHLSLKRAQS